MIWAWNLVIKALFGLNVILSNNVCWPTTVQYIRVDGGDEVVCNYNENTDRPSHLWLASKKDKEKINRNFYHKKTHDLSLITTWNKNSVEALQHVRGEKTTSWSSTTSEGMNILTLTLNHLLLAASLVCGGEVHRPQQSRSKPTSKWHSYHTADGTELLTVSSTQNPPLCKGHLLYKNSQHCQCPKDATCKLHWTAPKSQSTRGPWEKHCAHRPPHRLSIIEAWKLSA